MEGRSNQHSYLTKPENFLSEIGFFYAVDKVVGTVENQRKNKQIIDY